MTKLDERARSLIASDVELLRLFSRSTWTTDLKESTLTSRCARIGSVEQEARATGQTDANNLAQEWGTSLQHAKTFIKLHRDF